MLQSHNQLSWNSYIRDPTTVKGELVTLRNEN